MGTENAELLLFEWEIFSSRDGTAMLIMVPWLQECGREPLDNEREESGNFVPRVDIALCWYNECNLDLELVNDGLMFLDAQQLLKGGIWGSHLRIWHY
eukprot:10631807-Ditylum_brightwellii.AAC.1